MKSDLRRSHRDHQDQNQKIFEEKREAKSRGVEGCEGPGGGGGKLTLFRSYCVLAMVIRTPWQATQGVALLAAI